MSSNLTHRVTTLQPSKKECEPCACPTCGGLECLCRPRFFAGQLLTDETFNSLDHYIIEKNKLHNRYLHGWGVVCGLEVVCGPCNQVTVRPGYALSPCGDDIIVCKATSVDICELINKCKSKVPEWECEPFPSGGNQDCLDQEEEWILTIRYDEKSSRGITALRASSGASCCSSCNCGGSSSCGCGCKGSNGNGSSHHTAGVGTSVTTGKYSYRPSQATVAVQCEPTLTCESYVFDVAKRPPEDDKQTFGAMVDRMTKCFKDLVDRQPKQPGANATIAELRNYCCSLKESLRRELIDHPVYNCGLSQVLASFSCPDPAQFNSAPAYRAAMDAAIQQHLSIIGGEYIRYCICAAFLPPCPEVVCDPRVPIASVTVRRDANGNCRVIRVCNLGVRKFVTTFLSLGYWLSFLSPLLRAIRRGLETICCRPFRFQLPGRGTTTDTGTGPINVGTPNFNSGNVNSSVGNVTARRSTITDKRGFRAFASRVWNNRGTTIDAQTLFLAGIGARDENGDPFLARTETANPFFTVIVNNLAGPLLAKLPDDTPDMLKNSGRMLATGSFARRFAVADTEVDEEQDRDLNDLKSKLAELENTVSRQAETIEMLRKTVEKKK